MFQFGRVRDSGVNVIPPQKAGDLAGKAGLTDETGWCPVDPGSFESIRQKGIHVIGDSSIAGKLPKSAAAANSEAKVCATAIASLLASRPVGDPSFVNACYALVSPTYGLSIESDCRQHRSASWRSRRQSLEETRRVSGQGSARCRGLVSEHRGRFVYLKTSASGRPFPPCSKAERHHTQRVYCSKSVGGISD